MKTSELSGNALDWAVAKCEGFINDDGTFNYSFDLCHDVKDMESMKNWFAPSTDWAQGGPIIEREKITLNWRGLWAARMLDGVWVEAETPLIAAMRCYVANKLGDEVEVSCIIDDKGTLWPIEFTMKPGWPKRPRE